MSEIPDWKQKYRDSALEMEAEEKRWLLIEKVLRRLINRLCAAAMGINDELDAQLAKVAAANRRNAEVEELESLVDALTTAVTAVDRIAPIFPHPNAHGSSPTIAAPPAAAGTPARWQATCAAVAVLLDKLILTDEEAMSMAAGMQEQLARVRTDEDLALILTGAADLVQLRNQLAAGEREQAATVLSAVKDRLEELLDYFASAADANRSSLEDTALFDADVMKQVSELSTESGRATDLGELQAMVTRGLESVGERVRDFRRREEQRIEEQAAQSEDMRRRMETLESETRVLNERLMAERNRARIDPMTGIANGKAFDERLASEIARRANTMGPVTLLLWDIDHFKSINDAYGHRAGDRVLQSVAKCLAQGIRPTDFVARVGGEEFSIVLIGLTAEMAIRIANELRIAVESLRFHFRGTPVQVTVSCGITQLLDADTAERSFDRADAALYRAKNGGRNLCMIG